MAVKATLVTSYGESRELYVRLNSVEASNHGRPAIALFRGFISGEAFNEGKGYVWEREFEFNPDLSKPLWLQAYEALKAQDQQSFPQEPSVPIYPGDDASPEDISDYEAQVSEYEIAKAVWEDALKRVVETNTENASLGSSIDI